LTGQTTNTVYGPFTTESQLDGTYKVAFQFTVVEEYTLNVKLDGNDIQGSPIQDIIIEASDVQAIYSQLFAMESELIAG
jgi:hypothetical protein